MQEKTKCKTRTEGSVFGVLKQRFDSACESDQAKARVRRSAHVEPEEACMYRNLLMPIFFTMMQHKSIPSSLKMMRYFSETY